MSQQEPVFQKYVGLTSAAAEAIEMHRSSPSETESDIIVRRLGGGGAARPAFEQSSLTPKNQLDVGQGIRLNVGEAAYLFLSKTDAINARHAAIAKVTAKGLELDGRIFPQHRGSYVQRPMKHIQKKLKHVNEAGELISLSAYRQWHVFRERVLVPIETLKDASKARKRSRALSRLTLEDLDLD